MQTAALATGQPLGDVGLQQAVEETRPLAEDRLALAQTALKKRGPFGVVLASSLLHAALIGLALLIPTDVPATVAELPAIEVEMVAAAPEPAQTPIQPTSEASSLSNLAQPPEEPRTETIAVEPPVPAPEAEGPPPTAQLPPPPAEPLKIGTPPPELQPQTLPEPPAEEIIRSALPPPAVVSTTQTETLPAEVLPKEVLPKEVPLKEITPPPPQEVQPPEPRKPEKIQPSPKLAKQKTEPKPERARQKQEAAQPAQPSSAPSERGATQGAAASSAAARSSYGAIVSAAINARKFYPPAAREVGASGSVGVSFSVGGSGRVASVTITRSSGNALLDNAARQAVLGVQAPPPPGGSFSASIILKFSLR